MLVPSSALPETMSIDIITNANKLPVKRPAIKSNMATPPLSIFIQNS